MRFSKVYIESFGYELPPNVVSSEDIENSLEPLYKALRIQKGQLSALTGIRERRFWNPGFKMSQGAIKAGEKAIGASGIEKGDIGMLIYGGVCRDNLEPATACAVSHGLGLSPEAVVYDVSNACLGVLNGMAQIANAIELGQIKAGLVVSCESARQIVETTVQRMLKATDMSFFKESIATLTGGSGAVAVLLTHESISSKEHSLEGGAIMNSTAHHELCLWGPSAGKHTDGSDLMKTDSVGVLKHGVALGASTYALFKKNLAWPEDKPDKTICHQVGSAHQKTVLKAMGIPMEKDFTTYQYLGNIGTVSLPITAAMAAEREFLEKGDMVGFFGIGSGLNCLMLGIRW